MGFQCGFNPRFPKYAGHCHNFPVEIVCVLYQLLNSVLPSYWGVMSVQLIYLAFSIVSCKHEEVWHNRKRQEPKHSLREEWLCHPPQLNCSPASRPLGCRNVKDHRRKHQGQLGLPRKAFVLESLINSLSD